LAATARERLIVGHDAKGEWAIRPEDGGIERERARQYWPPWSVDGESLTVDSLDTLLEQLPRKYTLEAGAREALVGGAGASDSLTACRHRVATTRPGSRIGLNCGSTRIRA